jgi:O-antigen/teichoic acid export membrane protein
LQEKPRKILLWGIASFGLYLIALILPLYGGQGLEGVIKALILLSLGKWLWAAALAFRLGKFQLDTALILQYLAFCAPLMLSNVVSNMLILFDNWLVGWHYNDPAVFAVYRYGAREFPLATALVSALGTAMIPTIVSDLTSGLEALKVKSLRLMHWLFPLTMVLICVSKPLFPLIFNRDFADSADLFNIYLLTLASRVLLPATVVLAKGDSRNIFWVSLLELAVKFLLGFWFIQFWGLPGLAFSVVLSFWVEKLGLIWILERKHGIRTTDWLNWKWYLGYCMALFGIYWLVQAGLFPW